MTLFEYLAASFSVVLSFAVVRILGGISDVFARGRVYWVHAAWVVHQLLFLPFVWWNVWSYRDLSWNFFTFLAVLVGTSLLYYQAATLVPAQAGAVVSWRTHFQSVRRQFFGAVIAWALIIVFNTTYLLQLPALHPSRASQLAAFVIAVVGASTSRQRVQAVLPVLGLVLLVIRALLMLQPGALRGG